MDRFSTQTETARAVWQYALKSMIAELVVGGEFMSVSYPDTDSNPALPEIVVRLPLGEDHMLKMALFVHPSLAARELLVLLPTERELMEAFPLLREEPRLYAGLIRFINRTQQYGLRMRITEPHEGFKRLEFTYINDRSFTVKMVFQ
jgi:hypothetical protein